MPISYHDTFPPFDTPDRAIPALADYLSRESTLQRGSRAFDATALSTVAVQTPVQPEMKSCGCCALMELEALVEGSLAHDGVIRFRQAGVSRAL